MFAPTLQHFSSVSLTKASLSVLRRRLKKLDSGYVGRLAKSFSGKYSTGHIRMVLAGTRKNDAIEAGAVALLETLIKENLRLAERLEQVTR